MDIDLFTNFKKYHDESLKNFKKELMNDLILFLKQVSNTNLTNQTHVCNYIRTRNRGNCKRLCTGIACCYHIKYIKTDKSDESVILSNMATYSNSTNKYLLQKNKIYDKVKFKRCLNKLKLLLLYKYIKINRKNNVNIDKHFSNEVTNILWCNIKSHIQNILQNSNCKIFKKNYLMEYKNKILKLNYRINGKINKNKITDNVLKIINILNFIHDEENIYYLYISIFILEVFINVLTNDCNNKNSMDCKDDIKVYKKCILNFIS